MAGVTSGVGVFSGINTADIIDKLMSIEAQPQTLIKNRIDGNTTVKAALLAVSAKVLGLQGTLAAFRDNNVLNSRTTAVSDRSVLSVTASASAALGSAQFRTVRLAQTQRLISNGLPDADTTKVGAGTITVKQGGFLSVDTSLDMLNGGAGVPAGSIRITNRTGLQVTVDLSTAKTITDVIRTINNTSSVGVIASARGDQVVLTDSTGQSAAPISVAEVNGGSTGAALGLVGGTYAAGALTGTDVIRLASSTRLSILNDGNGVQNATGNDFRITARDGTTIDVDVLNANTIQSVIDAINNQAQNGGKVVASIDSGRDGLKLTDTTGGGGTLSVSALSGSTAARDLGIVGAEQGGGVLTGQRVLAGFNSVLLKDLNGGSGITTLGTVQFTDRSGASATLDFSNAGSIDDVMKLINGSGLGITAAINASQDGIKLTDSTGSSVSNLIVADVAGTTANDLHITTNDATTSVNSGGLNLQYISENTRLDRLNGGLGVQKGTFQITDSASHSAQINLTASNIKTVGDVIQVINSSGVGVLASLNSNGDGILLTDTAGGSGTLTVAENGGRIAGDLKLLGTATGGAIDGAFRTKVTITATDTINDVATKLGAAGGPVTVSVINDGSSVAPFHLVVSSKASGSAGRIIVDPGATGLSFATAAEGVDALLQVGTTSAGNTPLLFSSSNNTFNQVLNGVNVTALSASDAPVTVTINQDTQKLTDALQSFVNAYNSAADAIKSSTSFDINTNTSATLFGDSLTLQLESTLTRTAQRTFGSGSVKNLSQLGVTLNGGQLSLDTFKLNAQLSTDSAGAQSFLKTASTGFADTVEAQLKSFTDRFSGQVAQRTQYLDNQNEDLQKSYDQMTVRLAARRAIMESQFNAMEQAFAALQSQQGTLTQLSMLAGLSQSTNSTTKKSSQ